MQITKAKAAAIKEQAKWLATLASKIEDAANKIDATSTHESGTIKNLCPEVSKAASKLRKMLAWVI